MRECERASASVVATTTTTTSTVAAKAAASVCSSWCRITALSPRLAPSCSPAPKLSVITVIGPINRLARAAPLATNPFPLPSLSKLHRFAYSVALFIHSLYLSVSLSLSVDFLLSLSFSFAVTMHIHVNALQHQQDQLADWPNSLAIWLKATDLLHRDISVYVCDVM